MNMQLRCVIATTVFALCANAYSTQYTIQVASESSDVALAAKTADIKTSLSAVLYDSEVRYTRNKRQALGLNVYTTQIDALSQLDYYRRNFDSGVFVAMLPEEIVVSDNKAVTADQVLERVATEQIASARTAKANKNRAEVGRLKAEIDSAMLTNDVYEKVISVTDCHSIRAEIAESLGGKTLKDLATTDCLRLASTEQYATSGSRAIAHNFYKIALLPPKINTEQRNFAELNMVANLLESARSNFGTLQDVIEYSEALLRQERIRPDEEQSRITLILAEACYWDKQYERTLKYLDGFEKIYPTLCHEKKFAQMYRGYAMRHLDLNKESEQQFKIMFSSPECPEPIRYKGEIIDHQARAARRLRWFARVNADQEAIELYDEIAKRDGRFKDFGSQNKGGRR